MEFRQYVTQQFMQHPSMQPQDFVKLCYQAAYGAEHLLTNISVARNYFYTEYDSVPAIDGELYEDISSDVCRINLSVWKKSGMNADWLFQMFVHSASVPMGSRDLLLQYLDTVEEVLSYMDTPFTVMEWREYLKKYKESGMPAVHHSENYRKNECPAYRIINSHFLCVLPILQKAANLKEKQGPKIITIDGRAASGKSTMAKLLQEVLGTSVIHMDDFFLPKELRNEMRFAQAGGNVHYERFMEEVLPAIANTKSFTYNIFSCEKMDFYGKRQVSESLWRIVEGVYSLHPKFGDYADLKVFSDVDAKEQMRRIVIRNGDEMAEMFQKRWIPFEEQYFSQCHIREKADLILMSDRK